MKKTFFKYKYKGMDSERWNESYRSTQTTLIQQSKIEILEGKKRKVDNQNDGGKNSVDW